MAAFYALLYRIYLLFKKSGAEGLLRRWRPAGRGLDHLKRRIQRHHLWVRVQSGLSRGMWMHLRLPSERAYWYGTHEPDVQNAISIAVRPGTAIYDIGAHLGSIALGAARLVGNLGRVVAFDGDPENVLRLRDNSSRNGLEDRLQVVHAAVWSCTRSDGISFRRGGRWGRRAAWKPTETAQYWETAKSSMFGQSRWTTSSLLGDLRRIWSRLTWKVASTTSYVEAHAFLQIKSHSSSPKFTTSKQRSKFLFGLTNIGIAHSGTYHERVSLDACLLGRQNMTEQLGWPNSSRL
jgi:hypothetical protein